MHTRTPSFASPFRRYYRSDSGPATAGAMAEMAAFADVRPVLSAVEAPTLVLYRSGDLFAGKPHAEYLAQHISGAKLVELPGHDTLIFVGDSGATVAEIEEFLTGAASCPGDGSGFGHSASSTSSGRQSVRPSLEIGAGATCSTATPMVRRQLERFRGQEVNTAGDGFLPTFDGPGRAIQCACAIRDAVQAVGIAVLVGLHTGEVEVREDDVAGWPAVHVGARVAVFYTKLRSRLLHPLLEADKPPAPLEVRRALATIDHTLSDYLANARLGTAA